MGCTIYIIRPEHKILDVCVEICRLAAISEAEVILNTNNSLGRSSFNTDGLTWQDEQLILYFNEIIIISRDCKLLPSFCLRELRHAVETLHFKKPEAWIKHNELTENAINSVRQKSLGLASPYSCLYSPNEGTLKIDFTRTTTGNSDDSILMNQSNKLPPFPPSPSKTPTSSPTASPRLHLELPSPPKVPVESNREVMAEPLKRQSCPPKLTSPKRDGYQELFPRIQLRHMDENEHGGAADYGFYHPEESIFDV